MQYFYKYLAEGKNKDEALRLAKLQYLEEAPPSAQHPFHWNNYVLIGDTSPIDSTKWYQSLWLYLMLILAVMILLGMYQRKRKAMST